MTKYRGIKSVFLNGKKVTFDLMAGDDVKHRVHGTGVVHQVHRGVVYVVWNKQVECDDIPAGFVVRRMSACSPTDLKKLA